MSRGDRIGAALVALAALGGALWIALASRGDDADHDAADAAQRVERPDPAPRFDRVPVETADEPVASSPGSGEWTRRNEEGIAALRAGEFAAAIQHFEACLEAEPDSDVFAHNLAEALARLAREEYAVRDTRAAAIERLARAAELAPDREDLALALERWRRTAETEEGWWTDESEHFTLSFDGSRDELLHGTTPLVEELERAYLDYGELFGAFPVEAGAPKIEVVLYRRDEFRDLTGLGHWAGGAFDGVVRIPTEDLGAERRRLIETLRHELVHAFVAAIGAREIPAWLNEGLAQWLAPTPAERADDVRRARERLAGAALFPLADLRSTIAAWKDEARIRRAYDQSLAFVAHLANWYGERVLFEMVQGVAEGTDAAATFEARVGFDLDAALGDLAREL